MPANDYYDHGSFPSPGAPGASASLRAEFELIETGFNKMPTITGNAGKFVRVNLLGTALEPVTAITGVTFDGVIGGTTPAAGTFTTLTSTGAATLNSLAVTLNATIGGTLSATGTATFAGNAAVGGNLAVTGTITSPTITAKANKAGETYTGTHDFSGATSVIVPTATSGGQAINLTQLTATAFSAALPSQAGNSGKFVTTDGTSASWATITPPQIAREARTSNTILAAADNQKLIDITSGTFSQTFTDAATLGDGWHCYYRNSGTGDVTLDPNASETIDGLTSFVMYPGEARLVQCDGTAFTSVVLTPYYSEKSSSSTWTKPPGYSAHGVKLFAAGGGGGSGCRRSTATDRSGASSGAAGGVAEFMFPSSILGATETISIGAGGAGAAAQTSDNNNGLVGTVGGNTTFGSHLLAKGGLPGTGVTNTSNNGPGGTTGFPNSTSNTSNGGATGTTSSGTAGAANTGYQVPTGGGAGAGAAASETTNKAGGAGGAHAAASTYSGLLATVAGSAGGTTAGVAAVVGTAGVAGRGGTGGGGGAYRTGVAGGAGAAGGAGGGGGGGGAASDNGFASGAGGVGGDGKSIVWGVV